MNDLAELPNGESHNDIPSGKTTDTSRLLELANAIQAQVAEIQKHLSETGQPNPSFDGKAEKVDFGSLDDTRIATLENLTQLQDLLYTPFELLQSKAVSVASFF